MEKSFVMFDFEMLGLLNMFDLSSFTYCYNGRKYLCSILFCQLQLTCAYVYGNSLRWLSISLSHFPCVSLIIANTKQTTVLKDSGRNPSSSSRGLIIFSSFNFSRDHSDLTGLHLAISGLLNQLWNHDSFFAWFGLSCLAMSLVKIGNVSCYGIAVYKTFYICGDILRTRIFAHAMFDTTLSEMVSKRIWNCNILVIS